MIISRLKNFIFLESTGVNSERAYVRFDECQLIDKDAICTGVGVEGFNPELIKPVQNYTPITREKYITISDAELRDKARRAADNFDEIINKTLTLHELEKCGVINKGDIASLKKYAIIRNPIDRIVTLFFRSCERRCFGEKESREFFLDFIEHDRNIHHLWKDQWHSHFYDGENIVTPILYERMSDDITEILLKDLNVQRYESKRFLIITEDIQKHEWFIEEGIPKKYRQRLIDRYEKDISLWYDVYESKFNKKPVLFRDNP